MGSARIEERSVPVEGRFVRVGDYLNDILDDGVEFECRNDLDRELVIGGKPVARFYRIEDQLFFDVWEGYADQVAFLISVLSLKELYNLLPPCYVHASNLHIPYAERKWAEGAEAKIEKVLAEWTRLTKPKAPEEKVGEDFLSRARDLAEKATPDLGYRKAAEVVEVVPGEIVVVSVSTEDGQENGCDYIYVVTPDRCICVTITDEYTDTLSATRLDPETLLVKWREKGKSGSEEVKLV